MQDRTDFSPQNPLPVTLKPRWSFGTWAAMGLMLLLGGFLAFETAPEEWARGNRADAVFAGLCGLLLVAMVGAGLVGRAFGRPELTIAPRRVVFSGFWNRGTEVVLSGYAPAELVHRRLRGGYAPELHFAPHDPVQKPRILWIKPFAPNRRAAEAVLAQVRRAAGDHAPITQEQENRRLNFTCKPTLYLLLLMLIGAPVLLGLMIWLDK
ncbi:hypothetical protein [Rhodobacter sp. JA431]|uniref:hypothetical protein n=1 Tax=Rhodobacter sp. JA431 TaxID=570013 RepID=UPI000BE48A61|nr:hypothetical protein [Rhodobacter sp. JA431]